MSLGTFVLLPERESQMVAVGLGLTGWLKNVGFDATIGFAGNGGSSVVMADGGIRLLASSAATGPFFGAGIGIRRFELDFGPTHTKDTKAGGTSYLEVGVIVRRHFMASIRGEVPFFSMTETNGLPGLDPIALAVQVGFMF